MLNFEPSCGLLQSLVACEAVALLLELHGLDAPALPGIDQRLPVDDRRDGVVAHARGANGASQRSFPSAAPRATIRLSVWATITFVPSTVINTGEA